MSDSNEIKAGGAYVEIGTKLGSSFNVGLIEAANKLQEFGAKVREIGLGFKEFGARMLEPVREGIRAYTEYGETVGRMMKRFGVSADQANLAKAISTETGAPARIIAKALAAMNRGETNASTKWIEGLGLPLQQISAEFRTLGLTMDDVATDKALEFAESMKRSELSVRALYQSIGGALEPVLKPLIDRFVDVVVYTRQLIEANPELIQQWAKMGATLMAGGAALAALGAAIMVISTPAFLAAGAIALIAASVLAVTDVVGKTDLGFGDLFNSIHVGGVGLGTWMGAVWDVMKFGFAFAIDTMRLVWRNFINDTKQGIDKLIDAYNLFAPIKLKKLGLVGDVDGGPAADMRRDVAQLQTAMAAFVQKIDFGKVRDGKMFEFDSTAFKASLVKLFDSIGGPIADWAKGMLAGIPRIGFEPKDYAPSRGLALSSGIAGTFNAYGAGSLGFGNVLNKIEENTRKTAEGVSTIGLGQ